MFVVVCLGSGGRGDEVHSADGTLTGFVHADLRMHGAGPHGALLMVRMLGFKRALFVRLLSATSCTDGDADHKRDEKRCGG